MQEKQLIDDLFYVEQKRWGTFQSYDKDGNGIITALTEELCILSTRWYLKYKQEERVDENLKSYSGEVDYKL